MAYNASLEMLTNSSLEMGLYYDREHTAVAENMDLELNDKKADKNQQLWSYN